ncbi:Retrotransposon gag protein [Rhizoctonia solani]|uniref:Retrotransposon gag protein n=1 Tax=Rhizoctonia solani TaxID=456999 RepID=A0A8H7I1H9_9AGAM|nr:Retrotransposon gag protein [Rhizoctonia solani]
MATHSQSSACPLSPLNQGELGPTLPATTIESTSLKPKVYREISLSQAISLILGLQNQILWLEQELKETKEATKEAQDWMGAVDQALTCIKARGGAPHTPETETSSMRPSLPGLTLQSSPTFAQPTPVWSPRKAILPLHLCLSNSVPPSPQPVAPVATYQPLVKVDHPDTYTGKIGNKARQWLTRMLAWFLAAFGNPDAMQAAKQQITHLTQTGTCAEYITKFRTIAMDLDWNNAALCGQFAQGLHWEVSCLIATCEQRPTTLLKLQNAALVIDNTLQEERASTHQRQATRPGHLSSNPNFVSKEEQNCCRAEGLCIKCSKTGHKFAECCTGWKAMPKEEGVKKEAAKVGKESGPKLGKD